jgi:hypothetical protein
MSRFIIRVELHGERSALQYQRLHHLLAARGIATIIQADDGRRYHLPPAEYYYFGNATAQELRDIAKQCANIVDSSNAVVVVDARMIVWEGLQQVA